VIRAGTNACSITPAWVFNRDKEESAIFVARFIDNNNTEVGDPIRYLESTIVDTSSQGQFSDKP